MTTLERIVELYPLHAQVILERMSQCFAYSNRPRTTERRLAEEGLVPLLITLFLWADTPEGHGYWKALARAEGYGDA